MVASISVLVMRSTPTVLTAVYATEGSELLLGNTQAIAIICLMAMFVAMYKVDVKRGWIIFAPLAAMFRSSTACAVPAQP